MKKIMYSFFLIIMFTAISAFSVEKPVISFEKTIFNFGKVQQNSTVNYTFIFKNKGKAALIIDRVMRGCGCTKIKVSSKEIPAGKEGKIEVELDTEYDEGEVTKKIFVYSNDPDHPMVELAVKADVFVQ